MMLSRMRGLLAGVAMALGTTAALAGTLLGPYSIPTGNMVPNLLPGDIVFADPSFGTDPEPDLTDLQRYADTSPERGDVTLFFHQGQVWVKRLVGLPGETIEMKGGVLHIDGEPVGLEATGARMGIGDAFPQGQTASVQIETLPGGRSYRVLDMQSDGPGDDAGPFTVPEGHFFMMGDNRDNSADSRFNVGFVPRTALIGDVTNVFLNSKGAATDDRDL